MLFATKYLLSLSLRNSTSTQHNIYTRCSHTCREPGYGPLATYARTIVNSAKVTQCATMRHTGAKSHGKRSQRVTSMAVVRKCTANFATKTSRLTSELLGLTN